MIVSFRGILDKLSPLGRIFGKKKPIPVKAGEVDPTHVHFHGVDIKGPADQPIHCLTLDSSEPLGVVVAIPLGAVLGDEIMRVLERNKHNFNENTIILDLRQGIQFTQEDQ